MRRIPPQVTQPRFIWKILRQFVNDPINIGRLTVDQLLEWIDNMSTSQASSQATSLASSDGIEASSEQADVWGKYKKLRNQINNRIKQEEIMYKKEKVAECQDPVH